MDGDGSDDYVVGDPAVDGCDCGSVRVYSGSTGALIHQILDSVVGGGLGTEVAGTGDLDGDGIGDFAATKPGVGGPQLRVYSGATASPLFVIAAPTAISQFTSPVGMGDIDGDGVPDFGAAVSRHSFDMVVYSGANGQIIHQVGSLDGGGFLRVAGAGDVNGDGVRDLMGICGCGLTIFSGVDASVIFRTDSELARTPLVAVAIAPAGDLNGDGLADVLLANAVSGVTAVLAPCTAAGCFPEISPRPLPSLATIRAANIQRFFGGALDDAGDVDGDGHDDLIIGAHGTYSMLAGEAHLVSGRDGSTITTLSGTLFSFGEEVAGLGDVDGDGIPDVAVGSNGRIDIFSGASFAPLQVLPTATADTPAIASIGDVDGDQVSDFAHTIEIPPGGRHVRVVSGATRAQIHLVIPPNPTDPFGADVAPAGDVDADGVPDILIGTGGPTTIGHARVVSGATGTVIRIFNGPGVADRFGEVVAPAGDVDADGFDDVAVAASLDATAGPAAGAVTVFSGATGQILRRYLGAAPGVELGLDLAGGRDLDRDGFTDLAVMARRHPAFAIRGQALFFSGRDGSTLTSVDPAPHREFRRIAMVGDTNADGVPEVGLGGTRRVELLTVGGARRLAEGLGGAQRLDLRFTPTPSVTPTAGVIAVDGAAPGALGLLVVGDTLQVRPVADVMLLPGFDRGRFVMTPFGFDPAGAHAFPVDLRHPVVGGTPFYLQAFESNPAATTGVFSSSGLEVLLFR